VRRVSFDNVIYCDVDRFWDVFLGEETAPDLFVRGLGFHRFDVRTWLEESARIHRVTDCHPRLALPAALEALFRNGFRYVEDGVFDKSTKTWRFTWTPCALQDRFTLEGWMRAEGTAAGVCHRIAEMVVEIRFLGMGATLERLAERVLRSSWDESAVAMNAWLTARFPN
jgi:hypothetical protein